MQIWHESAALKVDTFVQQALLWLAALRICCLLVVLVTGI